MSVFLLNPPGKRLYQRGDYCTAVSKAGYLIPPIDFVVIAARLRAAGIRFRFLDAIAQRQSAASTLDAVASAAPEAVFVVTGRASQEEDTAFLERIRNRVRTRIFGIGGNLLDWDEQRLLASVIYDGIVLNYTSKDIVRLVRSHDGTRLAGIMYRSVDKVVPPAPDRPFRRLPIPPHALFTGRGYSLPFSREPRFACVLASFGCPSGCGFCTFGTMPFTMRDPSNVIEELHAIRAQGINEIHFCDPSFGADKRRSKELADRLCAELPGLRLICWARVDVMRGDLLQRWRKAGLHTVVYGVESGSQATLDRWHKGFALDDVRTTLAECRSAGIVTACTFMIGLPGESPAGIEETVQFALASDCDYASFNIAVPRPRTQLFREAVAAGHEVHCDMDQSGRFLGSTSPTQPDSAGLMRLRRQAERRFYFRPAYLLRRALAIRNAGQLVRLFRGGIALLQ